MLPKYAIISRISAWDAMWMVRREATTERGVRQHALSTLIYEPSRYPRQCPRPGIVALVSCGQPCGASADPLGRLTGTPRPTCGRSGSILRRETRCSMAIAWPRGIFQLHRCRAVPAKGELCSDDLCELMRTLTITLGV